VIARRHPVLSVIVPALVTLGVVLAACGADKSGLDQPGLGTARSAGCLACHTVDGRTGIGHTWKGLFGSKVTLTTGATITVDRAYLVRSIVDPQADIPMGTTTVMQKKNLTDAQVQQIVDYIITLGSNTSTSNTSASKPNTVP
jgi:cytochrome c oxidase subunit 2